MTTELLPSDRPESLKEAVARAADLLARGDIVALPTETVYGLAADATNPEAVAKIFAAKERPSFDPLIVHLSHKEQLSEVATVPEDLKGTIARIIDRFWPGPLTLVLEKTALIPDIVTSGLPTVAVRMSTDPVFRRVITSVRKPLAAPSANRFGRISPTSASAVMTELGGRIPLIVDGGACSHGLESTIIRVESAIPKPRIVILRPGPIPKEDLQPFGKVELAFKPRKPRYGETAPPEPEFGEGRPPQAPGQLSSHYAPATPLRLLETPADFRPEPGKRYALLSFRGELADGFMTLTDWEEVAILSPGSGKIPEAAVRLFHSLRLLDALGVDEIIAEPVREIGLGVAIMDRLRRAAVR